MSLAPSAIRVKPAQAASMIAKYIKAGRVPFLRSSPGMGKSSIVRAVAAEYGLKVIDLRLSQCDPTDLMGFPRIGEHKAGYVPMETFPIEGDAIPAGYDGWLVFLDEFNSQSTAVQAAAYKLLLDRMVGIYDVHKKVVFVCAGNLETDNAIVNPLSTAMQSRLVHMELENDLESWLNWAYEHGIDRRITSYLQFRPGNLNNFKPDHSDHTFACQRTWEFAHSVLQVTTDDDPDRLPMIAGTIGEGVGREFLGFCAIDKDLPRMAEILAAPELVKVPEEPSVQYAITGALAHHASKDNLDKLMRYIERLPAEFQVVCLRELVKRNKPLMAHPALQKWITGSGAKLF